MLASQSRVDIEALDWAAIGDGLDVDGFAVLPRLLAALGSSLMPDDPAPSSGWPRLDGRPEPGTLPMCRDRAPRPVPEQRPASIGDRAGAGHRNGNPGPLESAAADLAAPLACLRAALYPRLVPIANRWQAALGVDVRFESSPLGVDEVGQAFDDAGEEGGSDPEGGAVEVPVPARNPGWTRTRTGRRSWIASQVAGPAARMSRLEAGEGIPLHRHGEGEGGFPLQLIGLLSAPGVAFTGGELILTEHRPRLQSRPIVVPLRAGDAVLIATGSRPFGGRNGCSRRRLKQGVSPVLGGCRLGLELFFDDAVRIGAPA